MKKFLKITACMLLLILLAVLTFRWMISIEEPVLTEAEKVIHYKRTAIPDGWKCGNSWIRKNDAGLYEMYLEGDAYERGYINGLLSQELVARQENFFVETLNKLIPSATYQYFLKTVIAYFNKDLDNHISEEYKKEIYGISRFASEQHNSIASPYQRILNYHGAHDIGHAMQNMNFVGCTSFGIWNEKTSDSSLLIGRNFDFYVGDDFAKEKIILFIRPDSGYKMMLVTWGGMIGVVSGMNEHGLTVTLNAAPSEIPTGTATPVSIVAREVLQYARTIDEAYALIKGKQVFVAETFMIGSAADHMVAVIEKTPSGTAVYYSQTPSRILCTNHFQSDAFKNDSINIRQLKNNPTLARYNRLNELLSATPVFNPQTAVQVLRDQKGMANSAIGHTNEAAVNQLIAHHSILFMPEKRIAWVSSNPYNLGAYTAYDLNRIFSDSTVCGSSMNTPSMGIPADPFLRTSSYADVCSFKELSLKLTDNSFILSREQEAAFVSSNPEYFHTYVLLAKYFQQQKNYKKAIAYAEIASTKYLASDRERETIQHIISECKQAL